MHDVIFVVIVAIRVPVAMVLFGSSRGGAGGLQVGLSLFLLARMTLIAALYDRYRSLRLNASRPITWRLEPKAIR